MLTCKTCGKAFYKPPSVVAKGKAIYCSRACISWPRTPLADRFFSMIGKKTDSGCILWGGATSGFGYGVINRGGRSYPAMAHRVAFELMVGPIPRGMNVLHSCDNPPCVNPVHLRPGTLQDNSDDMVSRSRQYRDARHWAAKLDHMKVLQIRSMISAGVPLAHVGKAFGVSDTSIAAIRNGRTWRQVV